LPTTVIAASLDGGQHLHFHGVTPAEIVEAMRQLRGGQRTRQASPPSSTATGMA
jgi:hypothetical protein